MNRHPGGAAQTELIVGKMMLPTGSHILDMGAGDGETVCYLRGLGYHAVGVDIAPGSALVLKQDMHNCRFLDASFDGIISQCSFWVSGDAVASLRECYRLLKPGGKLACADIGAESYLQAAMDMGFQLLDREDQTELWRSYYLEALWAGRAAYVPGMGKSRYISYIFQKPEG